MNDIIVGLVRRINDLLKTCAYEYGNPVAFIKAGNGQLIEIDKNTQLLGNKRYQRYTFQHGTKLLVTIQSNAHHFKPTNPLFESEVISILIRYNGEIINPLLHPMSTPELMEEKTMLRDALQMLIAHLDGTFS